MNPDEIAGAVIAWSDECIKTLFNDPLDCSLRCLASEIRRLKVATHDAEVMSLAQEMSRLLSEVRAELSRQSEAISGKLYTIRMAAGRVH